MANEKRPPGSPGTKRRRPPTVIDWPATEVPTEPAMPKSQAETSASPPADPVPPEAAASAPSMLRRSIRHHLIPTRPCRQPPNSRRPIRSRCGPSRHRLRNSRRPDAARLLRLCRSRASWPGWRGIAGVAGGLLVVLLLLAVRRVVRRTRCVGGSEPAAGGYRKAIERAGGAAGAGPGRSQGGR